MLNEKLMDKMSSMSPEELYERLYVDSVTGVQNRAAFEDREPHEAIAIVDMDSLKWVNDNLGHREGDKYLKSLATWLAKTFDNDRVYRLSGDEFVVVGPNKNILEIRLMFLTNKTPIFSYGVGTDLIEADIELNRQKATREFSGKRAPRGNKPNWIIKATV